MAKKEGFLKLSEAPFLKYLLSFVIGILLQMVFGYGYYIALSLVLLSSVLFFYYYTAVSPKTKFARKEYFGYAIFSLFIALGSINGQLSTKEKNELPHTSGYAIAKLSEDIEVKEHSVECKTSIIKLNGIDKLPKDLRALLYIQNDSLSRSLKLGDIIIFEPNFQPIKFSKNPFPNNYKSDLENEGFFYSQYLRCENWKKIDSVNSNTIFDRATNIKHKFSSYIESLNLSNKSELLMKAMLLGDSSIMPDNMRNEYSACGLSHILAVSGLHVGIIAFIIYLIFSPLKWIKLSRIRPLITILILWAYIFMIGFPPSAVRAAIMATFILVGEVINRKGTTINSLFAAALFMLLYNPYYILDVSFQLSFTAVFSIIYIYPYVYNFLPHKNKFTSYLSSLTAVTLSAQIGTLPLTIYYFSQLPLMGLITNLLIIPILPIIFSLTILTTIIPVPFFVNITNFSFNYIDTIAQLTATIPYSTIDNISIKSYYIVFAYMVLFMGLWALKSKRKELILLLLSFTLLFTITEKFFVDNNKQECKAVIYDDNHITVLNFVDDNYNYVLTIDTTGVDKRVGYMAKKLWINEALDEAIFVTDSISDKGLYISLPYIGYKGEKYLILNSDEFKHNRLSNGEKLYIDKAIVCNKFSGSIAKLTEIFIFDEIIITSNLNHFKRKSIINDCKALKIPHYDIKEKGAYIVNE